jgi:chromate transporter
LAYVYYKYRGISTVQGVLNGLRPAVIAMIGSAGIALVTLAFWNGKGVSGKLGDLDFISVGIFLTALFILRKWKVNPIYVMVGAGVIGICIYPFI